MLIRLATNSAALAFGALVAAFVVGPPVVRAQATAIPVTARAIPLNPQDPAQLRLGALTYLGGLHLQSPDRRFGGLSGLIWEPACRRLLAVTDTGAWAILTPIHQGGRLTGLEPTAHLAAIRNPAGNAPAAKAMADAESLSRTPDGATLVWFERQNLAQRYNRVTACNPESLNEPAKATLRSPAMAQWPENDGPEAAARFHAHQLVLSEGRDAASGTFPGLILASDGTPRATLSLPLPSGHKPTGLALLDESANGRSARYLLLTRNFSPRRGVSARLMLLTVPATGGTLAPVELAHFKPPIAVDNMEAVAIRQDADRTIIYLMSDNNFNALQRTLLLAFQWQPPA